MTNLHEIIYALSDALDLVGVDDVNHGKRVAYMALACSEVLPMRHGDQIDLLHASLLHDCGVSSTRIHDKLVFTLDWGGAEDHCVRGYQLLGLSHKLRHLSRIILYHHTHFETFQKLNIDFKMTRMSNLIFMVDRVDALSAQHRTRTGEKSMLATANVVREEIRELSGSFFDPELVDAFLQVSAKEVFWFSQEQEPLHRYLKDYIGTLDKDGIDLPELREIAEVFAFFVDAKSPFTADHSLDVAALSKCIAQKMGLAPEVCSKIEIAGLLHDLGKLRIPDELLDKEGPLSPAEFDVVKIHAYETQQILSQIRGLEEIAQWAAQHHEKLNGKGYPHHAGDTDLPLPSRIIAVADIFQALAQKRPYRDSMKPLQILEILQQKVMEGSLDNKVVATVEQNMQRCWEMAIAHSTTAG